MQFDKKISRLFGDKVEWLLCDYFDTLVGRKCSPEQIKMLWAKRVSSCMNMFLLPEQIFKIRNTAEKYLSQKYNGLLRKSYNYEDLCRNIYDRILTINVQKVMEFWDNWFQFYETSFSLEIQLEKQYQYVRKDGMYLLNHARDMHWKVAIVSDFYMGKNAFSLFADKSVLDRADEIFISSDYGARKDLGSLYTCVLKELNVSPEKCLMIGDNKFSDFLMPRKYGIKSVWIKRNGKDDKKYNKECIINNLQKLSRNNRKNIYVNYVFSLYYFIATLYTKLRQENVSLILFCSREGEFLRELFNLYIEINDLETIQNKYFYVSRLSTYIPSLKPLEKEDFSILFRQYKDLSPRSFMISLGLKSEDIGLICDDTCINGDCIIENFFESKEFSLLKKNDIFCERYQNNRIKQLENFHKYLHSVIGDSNRIDIVDVGWKGTIQDNIYNILGNEKRIQGYYLGLSDNLCVKKGNEKEGINFSAYPIQTEGYDIWSYDKSFYEKILYASHSSVIGYDDAGKPIFECFADEERTYRYIRPYQKQMKNVFIEIGKIMKESCYQPSDLERVFRKIHLRNICIINKKIL